MSSSSAPFASFDLEELVHLEQTYFDAGYKDGYTHGRTHGLIEGRALGREKGYELWEEIGFYEGFVKVWEATNKKPGHATESRTESHIRHLLDLISQFPKVNPSAASDGAEDAQLDVAAILSKIRARYKALCATLGVRPRLRATGSNAIVVEASGEDPECRGGEVWKLGRKSPPPGSNEMSF